MAKSRDLNLEGRLQAIEHMLAVQIAGTWAPLSSEQVDELIARYIATADRATVAGLDAAQSDALAAEHRDYLAALFRRVREIWVLVALAPR